MNSAFQLIRKWFFSRQQAKPPIHVKIVTTEQAGKLEPDNKIKLKFVEIHT